MDNKSTKKSIVLLILTFLFFCGGVQISNAQDSIKTINRISVDSIKITKPEQLGDPKSVDFRIPSESKIKDYKKQKDFQYDQEAKEPGWFARFLAWIASLLGRGFGGAVTLPFWSYLILGILIAVIIYIIFKVFKINFRAIFGKQKLKPEESDISIYSNDVNELDLDKLSAEAILNKEYRLAVRYLYLANLKKMSDKNIIKWSLHKTNMSYSHEIIDPDMRKEFVYATIIFDHVWYGEISLNESSFERIKAELDNFKRMIGNER